MISSRGVHEMSRIGFKLIPTLDPTTSGGGGQNPLSTEQNSGLIVRVSTGGGQIWLKAIKDDCSCRSSNNGTIWTEILLEMKVRAVGMDGISWFRFPDGKTDT